MDFDQVDPPRESRAEPLRHALRAALLVALAVAMLGSQTSCSLLVRTTRAQAPGQPGAHEAAPPPPDGEAPVAPLTGREKLLYFFDNLGEIEPGLAYRTSEPSLSVIRFLAERARLRHVINLKKSNRMPEIREFIASIGGTYTHVPMSASRPPTPRKVLELIRVTLLAEREGNSFVMHCHGGADRTGMMTAIWRMLFQGVTDRGQLQQEAVYFRHVPPAHPNVFRIIDLFPVELFRPFVENPSLLNDEERIRELEARFFDEYPLRSGSTEVESGPLRAGVAKEDLLEGWSEQVQMATYGPFPAVSAGVREPVYARAMVLEAGGMRLAVVSCDLLITDVTMRDLVAARLAADGVELHDLLLCATHTHTSVGAYVDSWIYELYMFGSFEESLRDHLVSRIVAAVKAAARSVRPARLGADGASVEGISYNRRLDTTVDPEVGLIRITDHEGEPLALMVNFAAHPILAIPDQISSDYPGLLMEKIDQKFGFGLFLGGALGDQNAKAPGARAGSRSPEDPARVADALFAAISPVVLGIETRPDIELGSMTMSFRLPPFNANPIPDLLFPIKWLAEAAIPWPEYAPLQAVRLGEVALVATASEVTVALGLDLKKRSPVPRTFVVTHAGGYAGYALTQCNYPKGKLDPTSVVSLNGPTHGIKVVNSALDMLRELWKGEIPAGAPGESEPSGATGPEHGEDGSQSRSPTLPQSRRFDHFVVDGVRDDVRLETSFSYLSKLRGGDGSRGRRREATARIEVRGPWDLQIDLEAGYVRSEWRTSLGRKGDDGPTDLSFGIQRAFLVAENRLEGHGLRAIPRIATTAPTGDADPSAPYAFAPAAGVWRPSGGGALELTWSTYRTITLESWYTTAIDRYRGRRPGDRWESLLTYSERHGLASLFLGLHTALQLEDRRRGGRQEVDVQERSFEMGLRPGISIHIGERVELFGRLNVPLYRDGDGAGEGRGGVFGLIIGF